MFFISKNSATQGEESHTSGIFVARELLSGVLAARLLTCSPVWVRRGGKQVHLPKKDSNTKSKSKRIKTERNKNKAKAKKHQKLLSGVLAARLLTCFPVWVRRGGKQVHLPQKDSNTKSKRHKNTKRRKGELSSVSKLKMGF